MKKPAKRQLGTDSKFNQRKFVILAAGLVIVGVGLVVISRASFPTYTTSWDFWGPRIKGCESGSGPGSAGSYVAQNSTSTASGAYQFLDSTWNNYKGYPKARLAPPEIQEEKAYDTFLRRGTQPWVASFYCWHTGDIPPPETVLREKQSSDIGPLVPGAKSLAEDSKTVVIVNTPPADGLDPWVASPLVQFLRLVGLLRY